MGVPWKSGPVHYLATCAVLGVGYFALAAAGSVVQFPGEIQAVWWPVGWGAGFLYLFGIRHWPGAFLADLLLGVTGTPALLNLAQTLGNTAELLVAALLARRLLAGRGDLARTDDVARLLVAVAIGTALSATVGVASLLVNGDLEPGRALDAWRTWWAGDTAGGILVMPLLLVWATTRSTHRLTAARAVEVVGLLAVVVGTSVIGFSGRHPLTYLVFPSLIWAALRFGLHGATASTAVAAVTAVGLTAANRGPFVVSSIDDTVLSVQLYVLTAAVTNLFLGAAVSARRSAAVALVRAQRGEAEQAVLARQRIARDLHDSVSQTLFSLTLQAGAAQHLLSTPGRETGAAEPVREVGRLAHGALAELRALIFELRPEALAEEGLAAALTKQAAALTTQRDVAVTVEGPPGRLPLTARAEEHLYRLAQEALGNAVTHSGAETVRVLVTATDDAVRVEVTDDGHGFDPERTYAGHLGLHTMRGRAAELGGVLHIDSGEIGTTVRVTVPATAGDATLGSRG